MGINTNTPVNLMLDVGSLTIGTADIGATGPEGSFAVEQEIYTPDLGGARGPLVGTRKIITETAKLTFTFKEPTIFNLAKSVPGISSASDANSEYTVKDSVGALQSALHATVTWVGSTLGGKQVKVILDNALADGGLSLSLNDKGESEWEATFVAHYSTAAPSTRPWQLLKQK